MITARNALVLLRGLTSGRAEIGGNLRNSLLNSLLAGNFSDFEDADPAAADRLMGLEIRKRRD